MDLVALHAVCEANYARLLRLFPEYENSNVREFSVGNASVRLEVVERCRYTTIFHLQQHHAEAVEQIEPKTAVVHRGVGVLVDGAEDLHVDELRSGGDAAVRRAVAARVERGAERQVEVRPSQRRSGLQERQRFTGGARRGPPGGAPRAG